METIYPVLVADDGEEKPTILRRLNPFIPAQEVNLEEEAARERGAAMALGKLPHTNFRIETRTAEELGLS